MAQGQHPSQHGAVDSGLSTPLQAGGDGAHHSACVSAIPELLWLVAHLGVLVDEHESVGHVVVAQVHDAAAHPLPQALLAAPQDGAHHLAHPRRLLHPVQALRTHRRRRHPSVVITHAHASHACGKRKSTLESWLGWWAPY